MNLNSLRIYEFIDCKYMRSRSFVRLIQVIQPYSVAQLNGATVHTHCFNRVIILLTDLTENWREALVERCWNIISHTLALHIFYVVHAKYMRFYLKIPNRTRLMYRYGCMYSSIRQLWKWQREEDTTNDITISLRTYPSTAAPPYEEPVQSATRTIRHFSHFRIRLRGI